MALIMFSDTVIPYITLYSVANVGIRQEDIPLIYLAGGCATFFTSRLIGRLADRHGKVRIYRIVALCSMAPLLIQTHLVPIPLWLMIVASTVFFIFVPGRMVPAMAIVTSAVRPSCAAPFLSTARRSSSPPAWRPPSAASSSRRMRRASLRYDCRLSGRRRHRAGDGLAGRIRMHSESSLPSPPLARIALHIKLPARPAATQRGTRWTQETHAGQQPAFPKIRDVPMELPLQWLKRGWHDLLSCPTASLFYGLCFVAGGALMVLALGGAPEYIAAVTSGFLIGGPFFAIGLYEISRRREKQQPCSLLPTLMAWKGNAGNLGIFTAVLLVLFMVWARASMVAFALFYSGEMPSMSGFLRHVISTDHLGFLAAYFAIGGFFALIAFAISLITIPLMLDRNLDAITAAITSVRASSPTRPRCSSGPAHRSRSAASASSPSLPACSSPAPSSATPPGTPTATSLNSRMAG
jgi:uncharacterized membrane protein